MSGLYTERHGMRPPIEKTSTITPKHYSLLFDCCVKYYDHLAWKFPESCPDNERLCCGMSFARFRADMEFSIPSLFRNENGQIGKPRPQPISTSENYDQYALLDLIEFFGANMRDITQGDYHKFQEHYHLEFHDTCKIFDTFRIDINEIFSKTGLAYTLTEGKRVERIVEHSPLSPDIIQAVEAVGEPGTRTLLKEAIALFKQPNQTSRKDAVEKLWDGFERLKTYHTALDKKSSIQAIVKEMGGGKDEFYEMFNTEFEALTKIGNNFRIRHHETNKTDIVDNRHYDYLFNRCLSMIALVLQYIPSSAAGSAIVEGKNL